MARQGLFLIYTGEGKGKTTASLGVTLRAIGRGMNVKYLQFIKSPERTYGEALALRKLGVEMEQLGIGFHVDENTRRASGSTEKGMG